MPSAPLDPFRLLLFAIWAGALSTAAGLLAAAFLPIRVSPATVWYATTGLLVVLSGGGFAAWEVRRQRRAGRL